MEGSGEMLQRAANNAYSWWWASNIRTKQSKWLDNNLQEMEERVKSMVKLIEVDADSFAKKAELYFQRRPELINFVEETDKAYRALADRYDRISGDLHKANHTIASAFPDQFQLAMQDEEEDGSPKAITAFDTSKLLKAQPLINLRNKGRDACSALKKQHKKASSHLTKESAQNEIDSLHKEFIVLQTEKEFIKSSYERSLTRFWEIESQISDLQDEICNLQDEYSVNSIIENNEARALMAVTAFKSCEESLVSLQQQHKKSGEEADLESKRIREVKSRLKSLKGENCSQEVEKIIDEEEHFHFKNDEVDLYSVCAQVKQHFQLNSDASIVNLAEKIDGLVEKFISLEVKISSQTAQIQTLRHETDVLHKFLRGLEEDKANSMIDSNNLNERLMLAEDEFHRVEDLGKNISHEKGIFQTHFLEVCNSFNDISEKLHSPRHKEKDDSAPLNQQIDGDLAEKNVDLDRQKMLQCKYALNLQNYKDTKKRLTEMEMTYQDYHFEMIAQIQELKSANAVKDQEIRSLRRKLFSHSSSKSDFPIEISETEREIHLCELDQLHSSSPIEERFRAELDTLLDENLNFWLRFSTSYHHIQKFEASFKELQAQKNSSKEETVPLEKRLRELHTELQVWLEQNGLLKEELQCRFTALSNIQEEITKASSDAVDEDSKFRPFQAAKFQGELLNMQQENNKVAMELQTGLDHVKGLQTEVSQALSKLRESFDLTVSNEYQQYQNFRHSSTRSKVPLRTFLFGEKRKKPSIFSCMSPALLRHHHSQMKYGFPP